MHAVKMIENSFGVENGIYLAQKKKKYKDSNWGKALAVGDLKLFWRAGKI